MATPGVNIRDWKIKDGRSEPDVVVREADELRVAVREWIDNKLAGRMPDLAPRSGARAAPRETAALKHARAELRDSKGLYQAMSEQYPDLMRTYPLVFQFIVRMDRYDSEVFRRYLNGLRGVQWKTKDEWLESQTDYATALYRHERSHVGASEIAEYRRRTYRALKEDDELFQDAADYAKEKVATLEQEATAARRARMRRELVRLEAERLGVPPQAIDDALGILKVARAEGIDAQALARAVHPGDDGVRAVVLAYSNSVALAPPAEVLPAEAPPVTAE